MFDTDNETQERGQVGIGTLIVFIALVLVAAIAAGVLINTAGFLQSQAQETGEESTAQVANNVNFVSASGTASSGDQTVSDVEVKIQLAPGSDDLNLDEAQARLFPEGEGNILVEDFEDLNGDPLSELESGETAVIDASGNTFDAGQSIEVVVTTGDGSQAQTVISAPDPISESQNNGDVRL